MVMGTAWMVFRWLDKVLGRRGGEEKTDTEKMRAD